MCFLIISLAIPNNKKHYTLLLHCIPPRKAQKTLVMVVLFVAVYDAAIVYNET